MRADPHWRQEAGRVIAVDRNDYGKVSKQSVWPAVEIDDW